MRWIPLLLAACLSIAFLAAAPVQAAPDAAQTTDASGVCVGHPILRPSACVDRTCIVVYQDDDPVIWTSTC